MAKKIKTADVATIVVNNVTDTTLDAFLAEMNSVSEVMGIQSAAAELEEALKAQEEAERQAQAALEAKDETPAEEEGEPVNDEPLLTRHVPGDIKAMIENVTPEARQQKAEEILAEIQSRRENDTAGGRSMGPGKENSLKKAEKELATIGAAGFFCAVDIDPSFINRQVSGDGRFNVYALDKMRDLISGIGGGFIQNPINRAVIASMLNFRDAGVPFTMQHMQAAISHDVKVERAVTKHLVRHTVAAGTAPTQSSQMSHALQVMGVVTASTIGRVTTFSLTDTPQTRRLEQVLRAA